MPDSPSLQITVGCAQSLDGRIAIASGEARWISSPGTLRHAHQLRAEHDAVVVGVGTVLSDDPALTCRLPDPHRSGADLHRSPLRVVVDSTLRTPLRAQVANPRQSAATLLVTTERAERSREEALAARGVEVVRAAAAPDGRVALEALWRALVDRGVRSAYVEGGSALLSAVVSSGVAVAAVFFVAPILIGGDGVPALAQALAERMDQAPRARSDSIELIDGNLVWRLRLPGASVGS